MKLSGLNGEVAAVRLGGKDASLFYVSGYDTTWYLYPRLSSAQIVKGYAYDVTVESVTVWLNAGEAKEITLNKKLNIKYK